MLSTTDVKITRFLGSSSMCIVIINYEWSGYFTISEHHVLDDGGTCDSACQIFIYPHHVHVDLACSWSLQLLHFRPCPPFLTQNILVFGSPYYPTDQGRIKGVELSNTEYPSRQCLQTTLAQYGSKYNLFSQTERSSLLLLFFFN